MNDNTITQIIATAGGNFTPDEFLQGRSKLLKYFIREVVQWRAWHGFMVQITSAYRDEGSHSYGKAIDCLVWKKWRTAQPDPMHLWRLATTWPWMGVGIYNDWRDGTGLHVDMVGKSERDRPLRWIRDSGVYYYQEPQTGLFISNTGRETTIKKSFNL